MSNLVTIVFFAVLTLSSSFVFAQESSTDPNVEAMRTMMKARTRSNGLGANPMGLTKEKINQSMQILVEMGLMYKMMEPPRIISSGDGIIAAFGNKIIKYDKDLNVQKEVLLDVDVDGMNKMASMLSKKYTEEIAAAMGEAMMGGTTGTARTSPRRIAEDPEEERKKREIEQIQ